ICILAPAKYGLRIPVSCVEAGRWTLQSEEFRTSPRAQYASGRAMKLRDVSISMSGGDSNPDRTLPSRPSRQANGTGQRMSDQSAVWSDIDRKMRRMNASSATGAMSDIYEQHAVAVEEYVRGFQCEENQVGAAFLIDGLVIGLDLFDAPLSFEKLFPKLIRSYALDAIDHAIGSTRPFPDRSRALESLPDFLSSVVSAPYESFKAVGAGRDLRFSNGQVCGAALYARGRIVHLAAFAR